MHKGKRRRLILIVLLALAAAKARPSAAEAPPPAPLAEFTVEPGADIILVPVRVEGREREFLLDTGSTLSVFDRSLSSGPPVREVTVNPPSGPSRRKGLYAPPDASVGGLEMRSGGLILYNDFAATRAVADRDVWGLIGMQFLKNYIVQVDLDAGKVRLLDPRTLPRPDWGVEVPIKTDESGLPVVEATIAGYGPENFMIDTGDNSGGNLARPLFERLFPGQHGAKSKNLLFTGLRSSPSGRAPAITIGKLSFDGIVFESARSSSLGMGLLRRSAVTFDFPRQKLYLRPGQQFAVAEDSDMSGLHLLRLEGRIVALSIDPGSPAAQAGMLPGDVVLGAEGRPDTQRDIVALRRLLRSGDGKSVTLDVLRDGRAQPLELRLRKIL